MRIGLVGAVLLMSGGVVAALAQGPPAETAATKATLVEMTGLRDSFVKRVQAAGFRCPIAPPRIVVEDVPSFGQYNPETNTLRTSDWTLLNPREHALFVQLAGPGADEAKVRGLFEVAAHRWIFIHELGHWWQACTGGNAKRKPYEMEFGANRVSLAYWREVDPQVVKVMIPVFQGVVDHMPSPLPAGEPVEGYFNRNYEKLGPSPAYPWFMSRMNVAAYEEKPEPSFKVVLGEIKGGLGGQ